MASEIISIHSNYVGHMNFSFPDVTNRVRRSLDLCGCSLCLVDSGGYDVGVEGVEPLRDAILSCASGA